MANGYGSELWATDSIQTGRFARGLQVLAQALYRRAITPFGALLDEQGKVLDYGLGLPRYIGRKAEGLSAPTLAAQISAEFLKDDRVRACTARVSYTLEAGGVAALHVVADVTPRDAAEDFRLTMSISQARSFFEVAS